MDNKRKLRNIIFPLCVLILIVLGATMIFRSVQTEPPITSELEQYFIDGKVDSYTVNYGSGVIKLTLKEGEKAYEHNKDSANTSSTESSTQPTTEPATQSATTSLGNKITTMFAQATIRCCLSLFLPLLSPQAASRFGSS